MDIFVGGDVLDKCAVDCHEFDAGDKRKDTDLGGRTSFPLEYGDAYANHDENQDETRDNLRGGHAHHHFVQRLEVRGRNWIVQELLPAHEEHADDCKSDDDRGLYTSRCSWKFCFKSVNKILDVNSLVLVVETHHAEACCRVGEANNESERADKERPVEAGDDDEQEQNDEHRGAMQQSLAVLGCILVRVANGTEHGACHHYEQEREPEERHARSAEVLDAW